MTENTVSCPGCAAAMRLDQEVCEACRRPRDEFEIQQGRDLVRRDAEKRRRRPFAIARLVCGFSALAWGVHHRGFFFAQASRLRDQYLREVRAIEEPATKTPQTAGGAAVIAILKRGAPAARGDGVPVPASPPSSEDLPVPALDPSAQWAFCGRSYDLITLAPVADVQLVFTLPGGRWDEKVVTDGSGRFCRILPRGAEGGFEIRGSHPNYASTVLYESDIPYAALDLEKRRELAREAQDGDMPLAALNEVPGEESVRRDVFLAPRR